MAYHRTPNDRTLNSRVTKPHITRTHIYRNTKPHPAVQTASKRNKTPRRIDILPLSLTYPRLMQIPFDIRFPRQKRTWCHIVYGFVEQEQEQLRKAEGDEMECGYDTMDQLAAFEASGGVFGSPPTSAAPSLSSSPSSDTAGSSAASWGTASTFSARTLASSMASQPSAAASSAVTGSSSTRNSSMSSPEVDMIDASDECVSHVAAAPTVVTARIPTPPSSQPPQPVTTAPIAKVNPPLFSGLGYLPSKPLPTSKPAIPKLLSKPRSISPSLPPKDASKPEVELGMGSFSASKITNSAALVSAFGNPHFKQFFSNEMKSLQICLLKKKKGICGSDLVYLNRSLKWVIDAAEAKWFNPDIDFESDDVADWRGKLNIFMEVLGGEVDGIAKDTKERIEKVFGLFADEDGVNEGFGEEAAP